MCHFIASINKCRNIIVECQLVAHTDFFVLKNVKFIVISWNIKDEQLESTCFITHKTTIPSKTNLFFSLTEIFYKIVVFNKIFKSNIYRHILNEESVITRS